MLAGCGSQGSADLGPVLAPQHPDTVGIVVGASFQLIEGFERREYPAVDRRPSYRGDLILADGTVVAIDENTAGVDGCRTQQRTPIDESQYVPDYSGCLALALINEFGAALWVSFLDPLREPPDRWGLSSTPSEVRDQAATFPELFGGQGAILAFSGQDLDVTAEATQPADKCVGDDGEELLPASAAFTVDDAGVIRSFAGYGDADNPYESPCDWVI